MNKPISILNNQLKLSKKILIFSHINPDGDAIGCSLGLYHILKNLDKEVYVIVPNDFPGFLKFLPDSDKIIVFLKNKKKVISLLKSADLIFNVDFNSLSRLGEINSFAASSKAFKVLIDHHPDPQDFCDISFSDITVSSAAELVYMVLKNMNVTHKITTNAANCFLTGIISDTGSFSHNCSHKQTYDIVAELIKHGADKDYIHNNLYSTFSNNRMRLMGFAIYERMKIFSDNAVGYISLSSEDLAKFQFKDGDTEGFVNIPFSIKGIKVTAIILEKQDYIKFSFRSKGAFCVNNFAKKYFDGGGHTNASAGKIKKSFSDAIQYFESCILEHKNQINNT